ncbi:LytR/AlgR family response regulator transcription factor [Roseivirga sp.]|uniref:LytR/AlgR family response regulator transcription factor n=1 Tax=Roseivirga sp. TaxID=1964215 RepID=UPI003B522AE5
MRALIVEDEARVARRIERMTRELLTNRLKSLTHVGTLNEAKKLISDHSWDLVLLDLNLNGDNGFDLLTTVVSESFHTIIISAYKDQAITAFEYGVLDFVHKPFNRDRLSQAFSRLTAKEKTETNAVKYLAVKKRHRIQLISIEDIRYIKGAGTYSELLLMDGTKELHDKSLEKLEQLLSYSFERIHKSYLVKMSEMKGISVSSGSKYRAVLKNEELIPIGRTRYKDLKERWV